MGEDKLSACRKIGVMGGTFNPIHIGHLLMAKWAKEFVKLDAVIFMPAGNPYMKDPGEIVDGRIRLEMVRSAVEGQKDCYVSDMEIQRSGRTYTYETLQELHSRYPDAELYFIAGADCLYAFDKWVHPEQILANSKLIAAARNGTATQEMKRTRDELMQRFGGEIILLEFPTLEVSSTMLRQRVREGKSIRYLTPDSVCGYIYENHLYV